MVTIAGGIILAIVIIYTFPVWFPIVVGMGMIAIVLALLLVVGAVFYHFPEAGIAVAIVATVVFGFVYMGELWGKRKIKLKERKNIDKEYLSNRVKALNVGLGFPEVLIKSKSKKEWDSKKDPFILRAWHDSDSEEEHQTILDAIRNHSGVFFTESVYADLLIKVRESLKKPLDEGSKEISAFDKIEMVRKKEVIRLQKMKDKEGEKKRQKEEEKRKEEEEKRKANELHIEKFSRIKLTLQEIEDTYLEDKDIDVEINDTHGILRYGKKFLYITSETGSAKKKYLVFDGRNRTYPENHFSDSEKTIDYIVHKIGVFLAKRK